MKLSSAAVVSLMAVAYTEAFHPSGTSAFTRRSTALHMSSRPSTPNNKKKGKQHFMSSSPTSSESDTAVPVVISGNNILVTEALRTHVTRKMDKVLGKLASSGAVQDCDIHLTVNKNPKVKNAHTAEVVTSVKGTVIRCAESLPNMYDAIDAVTARLSRKLRKYKERRLQGYHGGVNIGENMAEVLASIEDLEGEDMAGGGDEFVDPEAPQITKIKSYDLTKAISIEEAVFALDYIDHDFYVFRDAGTGEVSVIYKRNGGRGLGLIQPEQPEADVKP